MRRYVLIVLAAALAMGRAMGSLFAEEFHEGGQPDSRIPQPLAHLQLGERLAFHGRWFGIPIGYGWIEVKERVNLNGRPAYHIQAEGSSNDFLSTFYPVHDVLHSYLDAGTLQPLQFEKSQHEGRYRADEIVTFDYALGRATYHSRLNGSTKDIVISPDTHDIISSFYRLRTQPIEVSRSVMMNVYSDEQIYRMEIRPLRTTRLDLFKHGSFSCLVVEPIATFQGILIQRGRVIAYVSTDARRVPLLVKISTPWGPMTGVIDHTSLSEALRSSREPAAAESHSDDATGDPASS